MDERFRPEDRLLCKADFHAVFQKGKRFSGKNRSSGSGKERGGRRRAEGVPLLQFIVLSRGEGKDRSRLGLVVSRKVGKANRRNRIKRLIREVFRRERRLFSEPIDLVVRALDPGATDLTHNEVTGEFQRFAEAMTRRSMR